MIKTSLFFNILLFEFLILISIMGLVEKTVPVTSIHKMEKKKITIYGGESN